MAQNMDARKAALESRMQEPEMMPEAAPAPAAPDMSDPVSMLEQLRPVVVPGNEEIFEQALDMLREALGSGPRQADPGMDPSAETEAPMELPQ